MTRRTFVALAGVTVASAWTGRALGALRRLAATRFATQPGWSLAPLTINTPASSVAPGYLFLVPSPPGAPTPGASGPLIMDNDGEPVWFLPLATESALNFKAQRYKGKPVLTWYEGGTSGSTYGGSCVIYDATYHEVKRVHAGNGLACDGHEFTITDRDTALLAIYNEVPVAGSPALVEGVVQETDIATGKVLFEWHSLDHVPLAESFRPAVTAAGNIDYFHLNSIGVDRDGNLIVSARHTSTIYKLDRKSGDIIWRLGGMKSDFTLDPGAAFNFQHDARTHDDGTLTLFDNGATDAGAGDVEPHSRPMRLRLDTTAKTATLAQEYQAATPRLAIATGNLQQLPNDGALVDWGTVGAITEFGPDAEVVFDASLGDGAFTYRAFRLEWTGAPATKPSVASDGTNAYASWNGATEVAFWQLLAGPSASKLTERATVARRGFETAIPVPPGAGYVAVAALDAKTRRLSASAAIRV